MIRFKTGVTLYGLQPEMMWCLDRCNEVFAALNKDCVVTSSRYIDKHGLGSHHYKGHAVDLRSRHIAPENRDALTHNIAQALGDAFFVQLERDHWHIEFDPQHPQDYPQCGF